MDRPEHTWDAFICHAREDKEPFVRELAVRLSRHVQVWYDEFSLKVGDSLRREIDRGLAQSRYGVVVLSPRFFEKEWPQSELDALRALQAEGQSAILPVWLDVLPTDVVYSREAGTKPPMPPCGRQ